MGKQFIVVVVIVIGLMFGLFYFTKDDSVDPGKAGLELGQSHEDQGREHLANGATYGQYNSDLPSSGPHAQQPTNWGIHETEVPPETFVHNLEHGGVVIAYKPDLPQDQIEKLKALFGPPYSRENFQPSKALVMPRASNSKPIQLASWTKTYELDEFNEDLLVQFYLANIGKSPEPTAP
ncbi:DUF3105 domain-containing protein [Candidatus Parcubacteria bacterium]|nr:DUF3105 domain-containing protein [Candidatus Parcubacteria bacterium]